MNNIEIENFIITPTQKKGIIQCQNSQNFQEKKNGGARLRGESTAILFHTPALPHVKNDNISDV